MLDRHMTSILVMSDRCAFLLLNRRGRDYSLIVFNEFNCIFIVIKDQTDDGINRFIV